MKEFVRYSLIALCCIALFGGAALIVMDYWIGCGLVALAALLFWIAGP